MVAVPPLRPSDAWFDPATGRPTDQFARTWEYLWKRTGVPIDTVGNVSAYGKFFVTEATPEAGTEATIDLRIQSTDGTVRPASIKMSSRAGGESEIDLTADAVKVHASTFEVNGTVLEDGAIVTGHLGANAATLPDTVTWTTPVSMAAASAWSLLGTKTMTFAGGYPVDINVSSLFKNTDAGNHLFGVAVTLDSTDPTTGTPATTRPYYAGSATIGIGGSGVQFPFSAGTQIAAGVVTAGSHTLRVYANSDSTAVSSEQGEMKILEIRR